MESWWSEGVSKKIPVNGKRTRYQIKLLKPKTRIETPVNCITLGKSDLKSCTSIGDIGAIARGPKPWAIDAKVEDAVAAAFQKGSQFLDQYEISEWYAEQCGHDDRRGNLTSGSHGSVEG